MLPEASLLGCLNREQREAVECLLVSFDQQWRPDRLRDELAGLQDIEDAARFPALVELIKIDIEKHWQSGLEVTIEHYLTDYPELGTMDQVPLDLICAEYDARRQRYPDASIEKYAERFPEQIAQVRLLLEASDSQASLSGEVEKEADTLETKPIDEFSTSESSFPVKLGRYRLVRRLGKGGMGEVYQAVDTRLGRDVAVKILVEKLADDKQWRSRFEREARTVAGLSHPNILAIHDFGWEGQTLYAVTELLKGKTLRQRISAGTAPWREALTIGVEVAKGLSAAHEQGIVHRDVKPENVFLSDDGRVKVLDFGLARTETRIETTLAPRSASTVDPLTTAPGTLVGTIAYMAPEQVREEVATPQSDVFASGCMMYELLTGRRPFGGKDGAETMAAILGDTPAPLGELVPDLPAEAAVVVHRCLEKDMAQRYTTAAVLADALSSTLRETTVLQTPNVRSRRALFAAVCAMLIAIMLWFARGQFGLSRSIDSIAVLPLASANEADIAFLNDTLTDGLRNRLSQITGLRVISGARTSRFRGREIVPADVGRELDVRGLLTGSLRRDGEEYRVQLELIDTHQDEQLWGESTQLTQAGVANLSTEFALKIAQRLGLQLAPQDEVRVSRQLTENQEALGEYNRGRYAWTKTYGQNVVDIWDAVKHFTAATELDADFAAAYAELANCYNVLGAYDVIPQKEAYVKGLEEAEKAVRLDPDLSAAHGALAGILWRFSYDWVRAERHFVRAIELNANNDLAVRWFSSLLAQLGRRDEALERVDQLAQLDGVSVNNHFQTGWVLYLLGDYPEAVEQLEPVAHELEPNSVVAHIHLGLAYIGTEQWDEALGEFRQVRQLVYGNASDYTLGPLMLELIGYVFAKQGHEGQARNVIEQLETHSENHPVPPSAVGGILLGLGEVDEAATHFERAIEEHVWQMGLLKQDAVFKDLRTHSQYQDILRRVNLQ